jgi:hypothetical protein
MGVLFCAPTRLLDDRELVRIAAAFALTGDF